jgi:IS5 family transposase
MRYHQDRGIGLFSSDERLAVLEGLGDPLLTLSASIAFELFRKPLERALYGSYDGKRGGRPPFDPVLMFKALVLQRLYNLSDDALEYQINDRLSFMRFLGLDFGSSIPDSKTIWLFRDQLQRRGLVRKLFDRMNRQLEERGIIANNGQIVDATFVEAPRQRNSKEENEEIKAGATPAKWQENPHKLCQKDVDARWAKKRNETHYGYKNHVLCDNASKLIRHYVVTDAAVHDSVPLDALTSGGRCKGQKLYGDSAFRSAGIEQTLRRRRIDSQIHEKGYRNASLTKSQVKRNTRKSRTRARVEHIFGFMTRSMGGITVGCRSLTRNEAVIGLMNITYNLCRICQLRKKLVLTP